MKMKDGNAMGINRLPAELNKNQGEDMHSLIYEIITKTYETGNIRKEFIKSRTIVLPKNNYGMYYILEICYKNIENYKRESQK